MAMFGLVLLGELIHMQIPRSKIVKLKHQ